MIIADASVLIAHLDPADAHHERASAYLSAVAGEELVVHPLTLAEVLVGGTRLGRGEEMLADLRAIGVQAAEVDAGQPLRLAMLRASTGLKLPDCCPLDLALVAGATLATFDERLAREARRRRISVSPEPERPASPDH